MATLVSPGVDVQVIDESMAGTSGPGTIPLIFIATKENKPLTTSLGPVSNTIAPGTVKSNAGTLYLITSQRELVQTFGDPIFYSIQGTSIPGHELNEYGLLAAYQYLGISNRAYVVRGDIDLTQMEPTEFEPTNPAATGTNWFDLNETSWGLFRSNGNANTSLAWDQAIPIVISNRNDLEMVVIGEVGFSSNASRVDEGRVDDIIGTITIEDTEIEVEDGDTIASFVNKVNNANIKNVRALALRYSGKSWVVLRNTLGSRIELGGDPTVLQALGFAEPTSIMQPKYTVGENGDVAVSPLASDNLYFEKIKPTGIFGESDPDATGFWFLIGSSMWSRATPTVNSGVSKSPYTAKTLGVDSIKISDGIDEVVVDFNSPADIDAVQLQIKTVLDTSPLGSRIKVSSLTNRLLISNITGGSLMITDNNSESTQMQPNYVGPIAKLELETNIPGNRIFYGPHHKIPGGSTVGDFWLKTTKPNGGAEYVIKTYSRTTGTWTKKDASFYINDDVALASMGVNAVSGSLYIKYNLYGGSEAPIMAQTLRKYNGFAPVEIIGTEIPGNTSDSLVVNDKFTLVAGQPDGSVTFRTVNVDGTEIADLVTSINDLEIPNVKAEIDGGYLKIVNKAGFSLTVTYAETSSIDHAASNSADPLKSLGLLADSIISRFETLAYEPGIVEPTTEASPGRKWYNDDFLADIMVADGDQWFGYRNYYPETDPQGVIIAGSAPLTQTDGSPLVEHDLWLDASDLENYPRLYRYRSSERRWESIDNADQTTPFGIIYADARWTIDGTRSGLRTQDELIYSDFLDPDAPDPRSYPAGMLLFNTRASTYNVKEWIPNYLAEYVAQEESPGIQYSIGLTDYPTDTITVANQGRWVTISGNQVDGSPYMGRKAQRRLVIQAMAAEIVSNQEVRSEATFFNLIAAPGYPELIEELITLNTDNKEVAFIVGDTPARLEPTGTAIQNWATNTANAASTGDDALTVSNPYVGLYYPWALSTNTDGNEVVVPPSSVALRTIAYNDSVAYPWFAPAGFNRGLITNAASVGYITEENEYQPVILNQGQRDVLYLNKLNPLAYMPGRGLVVFGQKTLNANDTSALSRINVARLINYMRYNYDIIAKPFLFEPNDKMTRDQVTSVFERFTGNLVSLRGLYDYAVVCDETNNTPDRIDRNELWIDVAIQPVKAIEFIYIPIRIRNTGEDLTNFLPG